MGVIVHNLRPSVSDSTCSENLEKYLLLHYSLDFRSNICNLWQWLFSFLTKIFIIHCCPFVEKFCWKHCPFQFMTPLFYLPRHNKKEIIKILLLTINSSHVCRSNDVNYVAFVLILLFSPLTNRRTPLGSLVGNNNIARAPIPFSTLPV